MTSKELKMQHSNGIETETEKQLKTKLEAAEKDARVSFKAFIWAITIMLWILFAISFVLGEIIFPGSIMLLALEGVVGCFALTALGATIHNTIVFGG